MYSIVHVGQCPELSPPANGGITLSSPDRLCGDNATYTCDSGYELELTCGSEVRTCQADGTWSGSAPDCSECKSFCIMQCVLKSWPLGTQFVSD